MPESTGQPDFRKPDRWQRWLGWALAIAVSLGLLWLMYGDHAKVRDHVDAFLHAARTRNQDVVLGTVTDPIASEIRSEGLDVWSARVFPGLLDNTSATLPSGRMQDSTACLRGVLHGPGGTSPMSVEVRSGKVARISRSVAPPAEWGCSRTW